jgi:MFS family permease
MAEKSASSDDAEPKYEYPSGLAVTLILTSVTLAYFLFFLDLAVLSTATPAITSEFDSLVDVGWYGGAYQLGSAAFQPLTGKIYSQFSTKVYLSTPRVASALTRSCSGPFLSSLFSSRLGLPYVERPSRRPCSSSAAPLQVSGLLVWRTAR